MTTIDDVKAAFARIEEAEVAYRATVRAALTAGVKQADLARELNRNRDSLRQDAMPEEERLKLREKEVERQRARRAATAAKKGNPK